MSTSEPPGRANAKRAAAQFGSQGPTQNCWTVPAGFRNSLICAPAAGDPVEPGLPLSYGGAWFVSGGRSGSQKVYVAGSLTPGHSASLVQVAPGVGPPPGTLQRLRSGLISMNADASKGASASGIWKNVRCTGFTCETPS